MGGVEIINFIDDRFFQDGINLTIGVYSKDKEKTKSQIERLIDGEKILKRSFSTNQQTAIVQKGNITIAICGLSLSDSSRGSKNYYCFIDKNIMSEDNRLDLYYLVQRSMMHPSYILKDEYKENAMYGQLMLF